jgi:transcriptional regulator with XRE-family HTH domain
MLDNFTNLMSSAQRRRRVSKSELMTPAQCRMARAALRLSRAALAQAAGVSVATLADFENEKRSPYHRTIRDVVTALKAAGVVFTNEGIRLKGLGHEH